MLMFIAIEFIVIVAAAAVFVHFVVTVNIVTVTTNIYMRK
jgi:hypothetical protein